jgi:hypothetical protein
MKYEATYKPFAMKIRISIVLTPHDCAALPNRAPVVIESYSGVWIGITLD